MEPNDLIDVSMLISSDMAVWPGDDPPRQRWNERMSQGAHADVSEWTLGSHTGTHIDMPSHFVEGGEYTDALDLARLVGPCEVVEVGDDDGLVRREHLEEAWPLVSVSRLLLKTGNSGRRTPASGFDRSFVSLDISGVELLIERSVTTLGVDYLSVERYVSPAQAAPDEGLVHRRLLGAGLTLIEGLDLSCVPPGPYQLYCLPLRLHGSEASPARAVLAAAARGL